MTYDVAHKTFIVVGLARSGCAAGALLRRHGARVLGFDDADEAAVGRRWDREGLTDLAPQAFDALHTGGLWPDLTPDAVIVSPGVPLDHVRLAHLPADVPVLGEMELGARFCRSLQVAVTGTNGKSTTTELIAHLLRAAGRDAEACGQSGPAVLRGGRHDVRPRPWPSWRSRASSWNRSARSRPSRGWC